jgi:hypothetical protein
VLAKGRLKRGRYLSLDSRDSILTGSFSESRSGGAVDWEAKGLRVRRGIVSVAAWVRLRFEMVLRWRRGRGAALNSKTGSNVVFGGYYLCVVGEGERERECVGVGVEEVGR